MCELYSLVELVKMVDWKFGKLMLVVADLELTSMVIGMASGDLPSSMRKDFMKCHTPQVPWWASPMPAPTGHGFVGISDK